MSLHRNEDLILKHVVPQNFSLPPKSPFLRVMGGKEFCEQKKERLD